MSIPVECPHCGAMVGALDSNTREDSLIPLSERIKELQANIYSCNHLHPQKTETLKVFGWVKQTTIYYPETRTADSWNEYVGPPSKLHLWAAIVFCGSEWITVNGKWARWKPLKGFYGNGMKELTNLPKSA